MLHACLIPHADSATYQDWADSATASVIELGHKSNGGANMQLRRNTCAEIWPTLLVALFQHVPVYDMYQCMPTAGDGPSMGRSMLLHL